MPEIAWPDFRFLGLARKVQYGYCLLPHEARQESCCGDSHPATLPDLTSGNCSSIAFDVSVRPIVPFPSLHSGFNLEMICRRREHLGPPLGAFALRALANVFLAFGYVSVCRTLLQICTNLISSCMGGQVTEPRQGTNTVITQTEIFRYAPSTKSMSWSEQDCQPREHRHVILGSMNLPASGY